MCNDCRPLMGYGAGEYAYCCQIKRQPSGVIRERERRILLHTLRVQADLAALKERNGV